MGAALEWRVAGASLHGMPSGGRFSHEVPRLIERIKELVAEERRLQEHGSREVLEPTRLEIARLKLRLAAVVKRELAA